MLAWPTFIGPNIVLVRPVPFPKNVFKIGEKEEPATSKFRCIKFLINKKREGGVEYFLGLNTLNTTRETWESSQQSGSVFGTSIEEYAYN